MYELRELMNVFLKSEDQRNFIYLFYFVVSSTSTLTTTLPTSTSTTTTTIPTTTSTTSTTLSPTTTSEATTTSSTEATTITTPAWFNPFTGDYANCWESEVFNAQSSLSGSSPLCPCVGNRILVNGVCQC